MKKVAFFDFCETLVNFQTADTFVDYVRGKNGGFYMRLLDIILVLLVNTRLIIFMDWILPDRSFRKKVKLLQLKGYKKESLEKLAESYYIEMIKPNFISCLIAEMQKKVKQNFDICIVSAGYSIYLKYFVEDHNIKHLISTEINFNHKRGRCLGTFYGKDCINNEKVNRIYAHFATQDVNYEESTSYSDSISDLPMLSMTGEGIVVSKSESQLWSHKYKLKEIIWR